MKITEKTTIKIKFRDGSEIVKNTDEKEQPETCAVCGCDLIDGICYNCNPTP